MAAFESDSLQNPVLSKLSANSQKPRAGKNDFANLVASDSTPRDASSEPQGFHQAEGAFEGNLKSPNSRKSAEALPSNNDVLLSAIEFLTKEFCFDHTSCDESRSVSKLSKAKGEEGGTTEKKSKKKADDKEGLSSYEQVLARYRPASPTNQPLIYSSYVLNLCHTASRKLRNQTKAICEENTAWRNGPNAARIYQEQVTMVPRVRRMMCKQQKGQKAEIVEKAVVKVCKEVDGERTRTQALQTIDNNKVRFDERPGAISSLETGQSQRGSGNEPKHSQAGEVTQDSHQVSSLTAHV